MNVKKLISFVLIATMLACSFVTTGFASTTATIETATDFASGTGTSSDPYVIETAGQLKYFRDQVNAGMCGTLNTDNSISSPKYVYVELGADIDLQNESWTPIGIGANTFRGSFDGKGHKITNLNLSTAVSGVRIGTNPSYGSQYNHYENNTDDIYGLFATVDDLYHKDTKPRGIVKNLGVENVTVTTTANSKRILAGVIVARPSAHAIVQDCYVKNVTATLNNGSNGVKFGGIAAQGTMNEINGCYVTGMNTTFNTSAESVVAPFAAYMSTSTDYGYVKNCYSADITFNVASDIEKNNKKITNISYCGPDATNVYSSVDLSSYSGWATGNFYNVETFPWAKNHKVAPMSEADLKAMTGVTFDQSTNFEGVAVDRFVVDATGANGFPRLWWENNTYIPEEYTITATAPSNGTLTATVGGTAVDHVTEGTEVTVTATPAEGYQVVSISANGEKIWEGEAPSVDPVVAKHTPTVNTEYTAVVEKAPDPNAYPGAGTEADPYLIGTAGQLKKFRDDVNAGMCGSVTEA
ncbi:MAG: hypothetical protein UIL37_00360, partial [Clostridia bacterium]|nr:hypothetical protein [Clostridia bacterium]